MNEKRQILQVLWLCMLGSIGLYAALPLLLPGSELPPHLVNS